MNLLSFICVQSTIELSKLYLSLPQKVSKPVINIQETIKTEDIPIKIKMISQFITNLESKDDLIIKECLNNIKDAIQEIQEEVTKIHARLTYNERIWFFSSIRCYQFEHCEQRLLKKLHILESRFQYLLLLLSYKKDKI